VNQLRKCPVVERAEVAINTEGSNEAIVRRRDGGHSTGVTGHGMLLERIMQEPGRTYVFLYIQEVSSGCIERAGIWEPADQNPTYWRKKWRGQ
jgi:hypothetical protein